MAYVHSINPSNQRSSTLTRTRRKGLRTPTELQLKLPSLLGASLDPSVVLEHFFDEIREDLEIGHLDLRCIDDSYSFQSGHKSLHRLSYDLNVDNVPLAAIGFERNALFSEQEMIWIEHAMVHLVKPLQHALLYRKACNTALTDSLTGLYNRRALEDALSRHVDHCERYHRNAAMLMIDVDHFKQINDKHGHMKGDAVLVEMSHQFHSSLRAGDEAFRFGGEEFVLLLANCDLQGGLVLGERLRTTIEQHTLSSIACTISLGLACYQPGESAERWLSRADSALYEAKKQGRNRLIPQGDKPA